MKVLGGFGLPGDGAEAEHTAAVALMNVISPAPRSTSLKHSARPPEKNRRDFLYL